MIDSNFKLSPTPVPYSPDNPPVVRPVFESDIPPNLLDINSTPIVVEDEKVVDNNKTESFEDQTDQSVTETVNSTPSVVKGEKAVDNDKTELMKDLHNVFEQISVIKKED